ncbi:MAG TPA: ATP synthase F1 subunit epsilon [Bryobacteraceae bacterium]|jgi:F-type H+-transporting ATPase subunit epsilon|nr:ATP synthase F1 subunit epsilon [Bryobacteraceae bacterium]
MADTLQLQLVSPERVLVDEQVTEAQIPAKDGFIGVLPGHAPLMSELKAGGVLTYHSGGKLKALALFGGFVEVLPDRVRVLADSAQHKEEIDVAAAQANLAQATNAGDLAEMMRAQARVDAALIP